MAADRMIRLRYVLALTALCWLSMAFAPSAVMGQDASSSPWTQEWENMPLLSAPGFDDSIPVVLPYWSGVVGTDGTPVKTIGQACPGGLTIHLLTVDGGANAWGRSSDGRHSDCKIWIEQRFINTTEALPEGLKQRARCAVVAHEVGHALGLTHDFRGDPVNILGPWLYEVVPQQCAERWPLPAVTVSPSQAIDAAALRYATHMDEHVDKRKARALIRKRLGKGWKIRAEVIAATTSDGLTTVSEVNIAAIRKKCRKGRCKKQKRRYLITRRIGGGLKAARVAW